MKYTIEGFSQSFAITLKKDIEVNGKTVTRKIDCTDLVILRWFVDFYPNMKKIEVDGKQYAWLTHKKLKEDLPIVDITKRAFAERMQKLVDFEILEYKLLKEGGTFSLYGFGKNYINMVQRKDDINDVGARSNDIGGCGSNDIGGAVQTYNKDNSIKYNSIKYKSIKNTLSPNGEEQECNSEFISFEETAFNEFWHLYPKKINKKGCYKSFIRIKNLKQEMPLIISALERFKKSKDWLKDNGQFIPYPATWLNQRRWEDEIEETREDKLKTIDMEGWL